MTLTTDTQDFAVSSTGAVKGTKAARFDLVPAGPLYELATHFGVGCGKYAPRNWEAGFDWSLSFAAMQRHMWAFWGGEDIDPETGSKHVIAAAWHCFALAEFMDKHPEFDDRPTSPKVVTFKVVEPNLPLTEVHQNGTWRAPGTFGDRYYQFREHAWWVRQKDGPWLVSKYGSGDVPGSEGPFTLVSKDEAGF